MNRFTVILTIQTYFNFPNLETKMRIPIYLLFIYFGLIEKIRNEGLFYFKISKIYVVHYLIFFFQNQYILAIQSHTIYKTKIFVIFI